MIQLETIRNHDRFLVVSPEFFSTYWIDSRYKPTGTRSVFPIHIAHVSRNQTKFRHPKLEDHPVVIPGGGPMVITNSGTKKISNWNHSWKSSGNFYIDDSPIDMIEMPWMGIFQPCLMTLRLMTWRLVGSKILRYSLRMLPSHQGCTLHSGLPVFQALLARAILQRPSLGPCHNELPAGWLRRCLGLGLGCQLCLLKPTHCLDIS